MESTRGGHGGEGESDGGLARVSVGMTTLSESQRRLVCDHMGLVGVHLRLRVGNLAEPRHDREREDLFQEGCLGLMRAAVDFEEARGIPFPAFALPRIQNAVIRALESTFSTIYVPPRSAASGRGRRGEGGDCGGDRGDPRDRHRPDGPRVRSLSDGPECVASRTSPVYRDVPTARETLGDRLRGKYERAVRRACELSSRRSSARGDRRQLAEFIAEERLLVPDESHRTALRQIARATGSSYARVADCERRMLDRTRAMLVGDPEFCALRRRARSNEAGVAAGLNDALERELARVSEAEFLIRFGRSGRVERAEMLERLLRDSHEGLANIVRRQVAMMDASQRERLLAE